VTRLPIPIFVRGIGIDLPDARIPISDAVAAGLLEPERAEREGFISVAVERTRGPLEMALAACQRALAELSPADVGALFHASIHRHGHKRLWPPVSWLHRHLCLDTRALALSINSGCNSAFLATLMAGSYLGCGQASHALVVGSDMFGNSLFDRFRSDLGAVYGDAAAAILLSTEKGMFRILHLDIEAEPQLEEMYRDELASAETLDSAVSEYDVGAAKRCFLARKSRDHFVDLFSNCLARLRKRLLASSDLEERRARVVVYPNVGEGLSAPLYVAAFGDLAERDHWQFGRSIGHTGVSDQFLGLAQLEKTGSLRPCDRVLLIGAGNGLSVAAMLLERSNMGKAPFG
jgi:3-oxoacyl-[acyl-carrier-protein] synthase III